MQPIFHITERATWERSLSTGRYAAASLATEGFIHCSTRAQVVETANRYYRGQSGLVLLCVDASKVGTALRYEAPAPPVSVKVGATDARAGEGLFPHVYAPIALHSLVRVMDLDPDANGVFQWPVGTNIAANRAERECDAASSTSNAEQPRAVSDNLVAKDERVQRFWTAGCQHAGLPISTPYQAWYFGDTAELAHELADCVVHGPKRAAATLLWAVERHPELAPLADALSVITERDGTPRGLIRTVHVEVRAFDAVDAKFAWDEGEGDRTLDWWRSAHWDFYSSQCAILGRQPRRDMPVVLERFELLFPSA